MRGSVARVWCILEGDHDNGQFVKDCLFSNRGERESC